MLTEKRLRKQIRKQLLKLVFESQKTLLSEEPMQDEENQVEPAEEKEKESMSASEAKQIILTFAKEELSDIPTSQMDEFIKLMKQTAERAKAGKLAGSVEAAIEKKTEL